VSTKSPTVYDADAPTPSGFWHQAVIDVPADVTALPADAGHPDNTRLPTGAVKLPNDARLAQYLGAAPPAGTGEHRYYVVVHALDVDTLPVPAQTTPAYLSFVMLGTRLLAPPSSLQRARDPADPIACRTHRPHRRRGDGAAVAGRAARGRQRLRGRRVVVGGADARAARREDHPVDGVTVEVGVDDFV